LLSDGNRRICNRGDRANCRTVKETTQYIKYYRLPVLKKPQYVYINPMLRQIFASKKIFTRVAFTAVTVYLIVHDGALFGNDKNFNQNLLNIAKNQYQLS